MSFLMVASAMPVASTVATRMEAGAFTAARASAGVMVVLKMMMPSSGIPSVTLVEASNVSSKTMTMSGFKMLLWTSMGSLDTRV